MREPAILAAKAVSFAYANQPTLRDVNLSLARGSLAALVGPNGSGKTTLLRLLMGILKPFSGNVEFNGKSLMRFSRREIARQIAFVPQELVMTYAFRVNEMVTLGRTPYVGAISGPTRHDRLVVEGIMDLTDIRPLGNRLVTELSGGEKQRVMIAMALAQEPQILLLDEPTVHLDINHQVEIMELIKTLNREQGLTVLATMHELNLAALYFDDLVMLERGRIAASGTPSEVLSAERIRQVFDARVEVHGHPTQPNVPQVVLLPNERLA